MSSYRNGNGNGDGDGKKKSIIIVSVSSLILLAMVVAVAAGVSKNNGSNVDVNTVNNVATTNRAVTAICQPTDYKDACISGLNTAAATNNTDPKELIKLSFQIVVDQIHNALNKSELLKEAADDPRTKGALDSCSDLMESAVDDLKKSIDHISSIDLAAIQDFTNDLKVWLSAAVTYQETCFDGFENTTGDVREKMRNLLKTAGQLTSNTLAIVDEISTILGSLDLSSLLHRRLLTTDNQVDQEGFPEWMPAGKRRLLAVPPSGITADVVVAKDGSGKFTTVSDAIKAVPPRAGATTPYVIHVKAGVYKELVTIPRGMNNIMLMGDGPTATKITNNLNFIDGTPTFRTATVGVIGDGFIARDIGFENSAGAEKHQAVALRVQSDRSIFYNCQMDGYQDTLYAHTKRQFYRDCTVSGTIDFIFGDSPVIFQNCLIVVRKPLDNQQNTVTAQGRKDRREATALTLHNCTIIADPAYYPLRNKLPTYLGRPWKQYSRCFIFQTWMDDLIHPDGWQPWFGDFALNTLFYSEFDNRGPGSSTNARVKWRGLKPITPAHAEDFLVSKFLNGDQWVKPAGVPYIPGLLPVGYKDTPAAAHQG